MRIQWLARAAVQLGIVAASAVGCSRESDVTIAPLASDASAPTPSLPVPTPNAVTIVVNESTSCNTIGPEGGSIGHVSRAKLVVPPGALAAATSLCLAGVGPASAVALGGPAVGQGFRATPAGQTFRKPVELELPFDPVAVPPGARLDQIQVQMAPSGTTEFVAVASTVDLETRLVRAKTVHFTEFVPAVNPNPVFVTSPSVLPNATVGAPYSYGFESNAFNPTWAFEPGSLLAPHGLTLTSFGALTGTLNAPATFAFFVVATNANGRSVRSAHSLTAEVAFAPAPVITSVTPNHADQGAPSMTVTITGSGFVPSSSVLWDGGVIASTFVSATEIAAAISAGHLTNGGAHAITVRNPTPGGGTSAALTFTVDAIAQHPVPVISSIAPELVTPSAFDTQITITGESFVNGSSAAIAGQGISTLYVSPTQLIATVPAVHLAAPGTIPISVYNPSPGGGFSATSVTLTVGTINPVPTWQSLAPAVTPAGQDMTLIMTGTGFVAGGQMFLGTTALATSVNSETEVVAAVPGALIATPGAYDVRFVNPAPGGGTVGPVQFMAEAPLPDAGAPDASDAGAPEVDAAPPVPPSTCENQGGFYLSEARQVTLWHEYDYLLRFDPCGSIQIVSCDGGPAVSLWGSGIATNVLTPGWYRQSGTVCEAQPPYDMTPYFTPGVAYEPVAAAYPPGCITLPLGESITMRLDGPGRCFVFEVPTPGRVAASFSMEEPMQGGASLSGPIVEGSPNVTSCYRDGNPMTAFGRGPCSFGVDPGGAGTYTISASAPAGTKITVNAAMY